MSLLQLPPEILSQVVDYVGSSYFGSDLSRLTVSKQWSKFAHPACYKELYIAQKALRRLLSSTSVDTSLCLIKDSVHVLDLDLKGFEDWDSDPLARYESKAVDNPIVSTWDGAYGRAVRTAWSAELNKDFLRLAATLKQSRKLRILRIQVTSELHPQVHLYLERRDYLFLSTIHAFLSIGNLTSLELDLCGAGFISHQNRERGEDDHLCKRVAELLTTLQRLRLRLRSICAEVLKPRQPSTKLRLNEVLVNLSLSHESPLISSAAYAECCNHPSLGGVFQRQANMEKQAQVLVAQMAAPKIVRVLTHTLPQMEMRAFDGLTGRTARLREGAKWDEEGEVIEDAVSDVESEISDLSSWDGG